MCLKLANNVSSTRLMDLIRERGVDFSLTPDYRDRLKSYKVDGALLEEIARARRK